MSFPGSCVKQPDLRSLMAGGVMLVVALGACRPADFLSVPPPSGQISSSGLNNPTEAQSAFYGGLGQFVVAADGQPQISLLYTSELLSDEFRFSGFAMYEGTAWAYVDARATVKAEASGSGQDQAWVNLIQARQTLLLAIAALRANASGSNLASLTGEAYALVGYTEILMAEDYCDGTPLNQIVPGGGLQIGPVLTDDSLLGVAAVDMDSAVAEAHGNDTVTSLASVGLGRALLDRGQYAAAATAVQNVPTGFVFDLAFQPGGNIGGGYPNQYNMYSEPNTDGSYARTFNVADREGGNGLNFVSANDPRLQFDVADTDAMGGVWYLPLKFKANLAVVPLATGIEARLIEAEAALQAHQASTWAGDLNALRGDSADTQVGFPSAEQTIASDSTTGASDSAKVDEMFRERAFWLFGQGNRLGDMRRLIRQYHRTADEVYPAGAYANGNNPFLPIPIPTYGADVAITLPTIAGGQTFTNPKYKGCTSPTTAA